LHGWQSFKKEGESKMNAKQTPWWQEAVFYHIYLRSFMDSNGDGLGDIPGLISRLDHLKGSPESLGIDAIWLSPFYPSPDKDFGYDVADYCNVDPRFGTIADFDRLISEAHNRGIRIMIDLVFNHSSDQHPWFMESRSSKNNPKRDWYIWGDARPGKRWPNNWQSIFGGKAWEWDEATHQFYYHMFLKEQPDLNWRNAEVQKRLMETVQFWLDRGVDGFRLDVFNLWFKHPDFPDNPPRIGLRGYERQRHDYDIDQPEMHDALFKFRELLNDYPDSVTIGEFLGNDPKIAASYCGEKQLHMIFNFNFTWCPWNPAKFQKNILEWERTLGDSGWPSYVLSNHDGPRRHISRYGKRHPDEVAKVAAMMLLTLRGTPFLYYGEEIGMLDVPLRRSQLVDPISRRYWPIHSRDQGRTPMQWDSSLHAGFTTGTPWLPVHPNISTRNVTDQCSDPHSVFSFYRDLLRLRRESTILRRGNFIPLQSRPKVGLAYLRSEGDNHALIGLNFIGKSIRIPFDRDLPHDSWKVAISSHHSQDVQIHRNEMILKPFEAVICLDNG
jgi:alpha-glucosidase